MPSSEHVAEIVGRQGTRALEQLRGRTLAAPPLCKGARATPVLGYVRSDPEPATNAGRSRVYRALFLFVYPRHSAGSGVWPAVVARSTSVDTAVDS